MKGKQLQKSLIIVIIAFCCGLSNAEPMGTAFTYQGHLLDFNEPANGNYDFRFVLFGSPDQEYLLDVIRIDDMNVADGLLTVELEFWERFFDGNDLWLEIGLRPGELDDPNEFNVLKPRQHITPAPYALYARSGTPGPQGEQGPTGDTGDTGPQGPPGLGDNLGDHITTQNINLNGNYLSGDGGNEGVYVDNNGNVGIGTNDTWSKLVVNGRVVATDPMMPPDPGCTNGDCPDSPEGRGLMGLSASGSGVYGDSDTGRGVYGHSNSGYAGYFYGPKSYFSGYVGIGVENPTSLLEVSYNNEEPVILGINTSGGSGVCGKNDKMKGELGTPGAGVHGQCSDTAGCGVLGYSSSGAIGVRGYSNTSYAGYFDGKGYFSKEVNIGISGAPALRVDGDEAIWYDGTYFSWGYGGTFNYFQDPIGIGTKTPKGALDVYGSIYQRGTELHADYVFEPDYELESIDEHAEFMWKNRHLSAIPKSEFDENGYEILEVGSHRRGIVEELEKAHIYIEQLDKRLNISEQVNAQMQIRLAALEKIVSELTSAQEGAEK